MVVPTASIGSARHGACRASCATACCSVTCCVDSAIARWSAALSTDARDERLASLLASGIAGGVSVVPTFVCDDNVSGQAAAQDQLSAGRRTVSSGLCGGVRLMWTVY
jgi:hypothetical protein